MVVDALNNNIYKKKLNNECLNDVEIVLLLHYIYILHLLFYFHFAYIQAISIFSNLILIIHFPHPSTFLFLYH